MPDLTWWKAVIFGLCFHAGWALLDFILWVIVFVAQRMGAS